MTADVRISQADVVEDRFSRFRLMPWWDQERITRAKVLVVGAGALGNEILKNLALTGFRHVVVVDCDTVELSNLARSVLYRSADIGRAKADVAAAAYAQLCPDSAVVPLTANVLHDVGLGLFGWADLIIAGLDNRESRLWINQCAWRVNRPWIDGAIESLSGLARVFLPGEPPCYECTLGEEDWRLLNRRMSCNLLTRDDMMAGKVPTTPTTASVIAGIQVQEALKCLHDMPVLRSKAFVFDGVGHTSYVVEYTENPACYAHYVYPRLIALPERSGDLSVHQLWERGCAELGSKSVTLEFSRQIVQRLDCPACGRSDESWRPVGSVDIAQARCPADGETRAVDAIHSYTGRETWGTRSLDQLGLPLWDVFVARSAEGEVAFEMAGDAAAVLSGRPAKGASL